MAGALLLGVLALTVAHALFDLPAAERLSQLALLGVILVQWSAIRSLARVFALVALVSLALVVLLGDAPLAVIDRALAQGAWYCSFLVALGCLPAAANRSQRLLAAGARLVQVAGRGRYTALTLASHAFGLMLSLSALSLLIAAVLRQAPPSAPPGTGTLAARRGAVLAILRGFAPTAAWSPLSVGPVVVVSVVPTAQWQSIYVLGVGLAVAMLLLGALVQRLEPAPAPQMMVPHESWRALYPVLALVVSVFALLLGCAQGFGLALPEAVMLVIPLVTLAWLTLQTWHQGAAALRARLASLVRETLPRQSSETVVLSAAGVIGVALAALLPTAQLADWVGLLNLSPTLLLLAVFWLLLGAGLVGISPLVTIILLGAVLADPVQLGLPPLLLAGVFISCWCLIAQLSPYSASALLTASAAGMPSTTLILDWNRYYIIAALLAGHAAIVLSGLLLA
jgi:hypothetical protein